MYKAIVAACIAGLAFLPGGLWAECPTDSTSCTTQEQTQPADPLETILKNLQKKATELTSYECKLDYIFRQPLLESQTRQTGTMHYAKFDDRSYLRIDFRTLQQDEEKEQAYRQQFLFDGVWLWHIDYQIKSAERRQITEPNEPADAFALASRRVPVLGFSNIEDLEMQFEIELVEENSVEPPPFHHLHLKVLPDSVYKDEYVTIDFWIDKKLGLPAKVTAVTTEQDVCEIKLLEPQVNKEIDKKTFTIDIPAEFSVESIPLEKAPADG